MRFIAMCEMPIETSEHSGNMSEMEVFPCVT